MHLELSSEHDWLPRKIVIGDKAKPLVTYAVTTFKRQDGKWYPAEGAIPKSGDEDRLGG